MKKGECKGLGTERERKGKEKKGGEGNGIQGELGIRGIDPQFIKNIHNSYKTAENVCLFIHSPVTRIECQS